MKNLKSLDPDVLEMKELRDCNKKSSGMNSQCNIQNIIQTEFLQVIHRCCSGVILCGRNFVFSKTDNFSVIF